jgi:two-component system nitrate/nitrite response regulator NarL
MRVLIVDTQVMFAEAIQVALRAAGERDVALTDTAEDALQALQMAQADIVLLGIGLPGLSAFLVGQEILRRWPDTHVLVLTSEIDRDTVDSTIQAGFSGILTRDTDVGRMLEAMRAALDGEVVMPERCAPQTWSRRDANEASLLIDQLTRREHEVLMLLAEGCDSDLVAKRLGIARNTVRTHVHSILAKLNVHTRLEAAAFAQRYGMVEEARERTGTRAR